MVAPTNLGANGYGADYLGGYSLTSAFIAEVVMTFIFLMVIFGATSSKAPAGFAGIAIGLALAMIHMVCIPITGTSVNPARSLGPAVVAGGIATVTVMAVYRCTSYRSSNCSGRVEISV